VQKRAHSINRRIRICLNHDIQTSAQEVEKLGMAGIWQRVLPVVREQGWYYEPIL
jgi:hypothetical protein